MSALWKAMLEAQKEIKHAVKDAKNPHFKNDYASLASVIDSVVPVLNKHGLVLTQEIRHANTDPPGTVRVTTRIVHAATGEQTMDSQVMPLVKNDPQGLGSAVTYARRYAIQAMVGQASEDDDGNDASKLGAQGNVSASRAPTPNGSNGEGQVSGAAATQKQTPSNQPAIRPIVVPDSARPAPSEEVRAMQAKLNGALGFKPKS